MKSIDKNKNSFAAFYMKAVKILFTVIALLLMADFATIYILAGKTDTIGGGLYRTPA